MYLGSPVMIGSESTGELIATRLYHVNISRGVDEIAKLRVCPLGQVVALSFHVFDAKEIVSKNKTI